MESGKICMFVRSKSRRVCILANIKVQVKGNGSKRVLANKKVLVSWYSGGPTQKTTGSDGTIDTGVSGPADSKFITVDGKQVQGETELQGGVNTVFVDD